MKNSRITVTHVNISLKKGTIKQPVQEAVLDSHGLQDDAHAGVWHRQVSMIARQSLDDFYHKTGRKVQPGEFAENLTVKGLDLTGVQLLDRFVNQDLDLEVTQRGKKCHGDDCAIFREVGKCAMPEEGIFTRVVKGGKLKPGDALEYKPKIYKALVLTLSDRAAAGIYPDKSGEKIEKQLNDFWGAHFHHHSVERQVLPDEQDQLHHAMQKARSEGYDVVVTTGGTGIGSRDIAPETARLLMDREIPGVMEMVRMKYGAGNPRALLSRSVAGVMGQTLVYTLPGSSKAVDEYLEVILPTLRHSIFMLHGLDVH
jgi:molybdenum cofactor synthesis domain-containing protein